MSARKILLLIMLVALAASALTGVLAVLITSGDTLWKFMGTAIATAVVTALLLPLSLLTDRPRLRAGGLTAMGTLLVGWLCVMLLTWMPHRSYPYDAEWRIVSTLGFTLLTGLPASGALLLVEIKWARIAAWTFVVLAAYAWLTCLAGSWIPATFSIFGSNHLAEHLWGTAMVPYGIGAICSLLLVNLGMGDRRYFRWAGVFCGLVATTIAVAAIWSETEDEFWGRLCGITLTLSTVLAHINLVLMARLRPKQDWLKWATMGCSLAAGLAIVIVLATENSSAWDDVFLFRVSAALSIAGGCGSLALIILSALNRRVDTPMVASVEMKEIQLACPRCGMRQVLPLGEAACASCQLQIITRVVEPRCPACGYNLFKLTSDRCPECGTILKPDASAPAFPVQSAETSVREC